MLTWVLMEHPPKQGLKQDESDREGVSSMCFNGTSTKTRIETQRDPCGSR